MADFFEDCELDLYCDARLVPWTVRMLLGMSWETRHSSFLKFAETKHLAFMNGICDLMGPDQLLWGRATGVPPPAVIVITPMPTSFIILD
jgi:hypothetical protein